MTPTPHMMDMLKRIGRQNSTIMETQIVASGGRDAKRLHELIAGGFVRRCDHATIRFGTLPAEALELTNRGRAAIGMEPEPVDAGTALAFIKGAGNDMMEALRAVIEERAIRIELGGEMVVAAPSYQPPDIAKAMRALAKAQGRLVE